jgi:hypothetical protein
MGKWAVVATVGLIALLLVGCGSSGDPALRELKGQASKFDAALLGRHYEVACSLMTPGLWQSLQGRAGEAGPTCEDRLEAITAAHAIPDDLIADSKFDAQLARMHVTPRSIVTYGNETVALWEYGAWRFARPPWSLSSG